MLSAVNAVKVALNKLHLNPADQSLSFEYQYLLDDTSVFESIPGGKLDIAYESTESSESESWFVCTSQTFGLLLDNAPYTLFYEIDIVDGVYQRSIRHIYEAWSKCVSTHHLSRTEAMFTVMENTESSESYQFYLKIIRIDFHSGAYSVKKQRTPFDSYQFSQSEQSGIGVQIV